MDVLLPADIPSGEGVLIPYTFDGRSVRVVVIYGEPHFVGMVIEHCHGGYGGRERGSRPVRRGKPRCLRLSRFPVPADPDEPFQISRQSDRRRIESRPAALVPAPAHPSLARKFARAPPNQTSTRAVFFV
jgi:hypothetical protein